jgi:hypothetical protein
MPTVVKTKHHCGEGIQKVYKFENGLCVSAIKTPYSYGGRDDKWEISVMDREGGWFTKQIFLDADDDVIGHIPNNELQGYLEEVEAYGSY